LLVPQLLASGTAWNCSEKYRCQAIANSRHESFLLSPGGVAVTATEAALLLLLRDDTAALSWRSQFASEPARCFPRFHGIAKRDHGLINVFPN
jgi:hypothetical protein